LVRRPVVQQTGQGLVPPVEKRPVSQVLSESEASTSGPAQSGFSIAAFNLANLFDTTDDPDTQDTVFSASEYQRRLQKRALAIHEALGEPEIVAVQEVENQAVLQALLARPEILSDYSILWLDGPDERGIDIAVLLRSDRVQAVGFQARQGCTRRVDGFGPDGNRDILNPQNLVTCDTDSDGRLDGNRLFSRPPLVAQLKVCRAACVQGASGPEDWTEIWLIANHFKSKVEDGEIAQYTLNRRIEEARFVAGLVDEILARPSANLVVLGDLNDLPGSQPLEILEGEGLRDPWREVAKPSRYSYIYQGISQVLDYTLFHLNLPLSLVKLEPVHINADYPVAYEELKTSLYRSSDHDPLLARIAWLDHLAYLPLVSER
jgi:predicted extracellular nuclease